MRTSKSVRIGNYFLEILRRAYPMFGDDDRRMIEMVIGSHIAQMPLPGLTVADVGELEEELDDCLPADDSDLD